MAATDTRAVDVAEGDGRELLTRIRGQTARSNFAEASERFMDETAAIGGA